MTDRSQASLSSTSTYRPWDREEKLGPPPWSAKDPAVIAWEAAHGHDIRLKCYPDEITDEMIERVADELEIVFGDVFGFAAQFMDNRDRYDDASKLLEAAFPSLPSPSTTKEKQ